MQKGFDKNIERVLPLVQKPARYIGMELNSIIKSDVSVRMGICYPDLYEVAMSNHGIKIIYDVVNKQQDAACERFFPVAPDFEEMLRELNVPLYTLEQYTPIRELDLLGYNVSHELLATNILQTLELGGIPLKAEDRSEGDPLIMAGGGAVSNPFPLWDFMDIFYFGDGEEGILEIIETVKNAKNREATRNEIIHELASIEGVMSRNSVSISYKNGFLSVSGNKVRKRVYRGQDLIDPERPLVPNIRIAQDRAVVEVARGCKNACKFCHAGYYNLPCRNYDYRKISDKIYAILANTGYNEVTLASLSISDYPDLVHLVNTVLPELTRQGVTISLPSLKVDKQTLPIIEQLSEIRRVSLTFAVESASQYIREIAHKRVVTDDFIAIVKEVFSKGWKVIKLYFMIGLPGCSEVDEAEEIIMLLKKVMSCLPRRVGINVTISPFVPKPHTPFQRNRQMGADYYRYVIERVKSRLPRSIKIKNHDINASRLEGLFSRGDTRLGRVILDSYQQGARFDSWQEYFKKDIWDRNLLNSGIDLEKYYDQIDKDHELPWGLIESGHESLIERQVNRKINLDVLPETINYPDQVIDDSLLHNAKEIFEEKYTGKCRYRLRIKKTGLMRFVPHLDFIEVLKRGLRMAGAPVVFTQGFNKREKIAAGFPLPLGIESECELLDVDFYEDRPQHLLTLLNDRLPEGIEVISINEIAGKKALMALVNLTTYRVKVRNGNFFEKIYKNAGRKISLTKESKKGVKTFEFSKVIRELKSLDSDTVYIELYTGTEESMRIDQVVMTLSECSFERIGEFIITKIAQFELAGDDYIEI